MKICEFFFSATNTWKQLSQWIECSSLDGQSVKWPVLIMKQSIWNIPMNLSVIKSVASICCGIGLFSISGIHNIFLDVRNIIRNCRICRLNWWLTYNAIIYAIYSEWPLIIIKSEVPPDRSRKNLIFISNFGHRCVSFCFLKTPLNMNCVLKHWSHACK